MSLRDAIADARLRVDQDQDGEYIASMEIRTRYALVDPILQALEWTISDPSQVRIEHETTNRSNPYRVDYALFSGKSVKGKPVILVEAKVLPAERLVYYKSKREERKARNDEAWENFQSDKKIPEPDYPDLGEHLARHKDQVKTYTEQLEMESGYAVWTDGAYWRIDEVHAPGSLVHLCTVNILIEPTDRCEEVLEVLRRGGNG